MSVTDYLRLRYLTHLSKPASDRLLYRTIYQHRYRTILEVGVGNAERAMRMIEVAALQSPIAEVQYNGIDLFEARTVADGPGLTLKMVHRRLRATGARIRLLPGDPLSALSGAANTVRRIDLLIVSAGLNRESLGQAWFYVPRMLHPSSLVLLAGAGEAGQFRRLSMPEIETLATAALRRRVA